MGWNSLRFIASWFIKRKLPQPMLDEYDLDSYWNHSLNVEYTIDLFSGIYSNVGI